MCVGRDLWRSSTPTPHSKQGQLQSWFKWASLSQILKVSKDGGSKTSLGNYSWCSHSTAYAHWSIPCCNMQPLPLLDSLHISEKRSIFSTVPLDSGVEQEEDFSFPGWKSSVPSASPCTWCSPTSGHPAGFLLDSLQLVDLVLLSVHGSPNLDTVFHVGPLQCWAEGNKHVTQALSYTFAMQMCR